MKKLILLILLVTVLVGCSESSYLGEYDYVEPVFRGGVSSFALDPTLPETYDFLLNKNKNYKYTLTRDSLILDYGNGEKRYFRNLDVRKVDFDYKYLYGDPVLINDKVKELVSQYAKKEIVLINEGEDMTSGYCLLLLDDDVFIAWMEKRVPLLSELDKIEKTDD